MNATRLFRALPVVLAALGMPAFAQEPPKCKLVRIAEWPIRLVNNHHPVLDGAINGKKIGVMLDTGADKTFLSKASAEKLDLPTRPTNSIVGGFGGTSRVFITRVEEVRLGEAVRKDWLLQVVGERPLPGFDLVLGDDFFKLVDLEFDYAKSVVRVYQPENCKNSFLGYWDPNAEQVPLEENLSKLVLPVKINGKAARAVLDSGAATSIVALAFAEQVGLAKDSPGVTPGGCSGGIGGSVNRNWVGRFDTVAIGNELIRDPQLRIQDYTTEFANMRGTPPDVFLGTDFLKSHRVFVSRSQNKMYFTYNGGQVFPPIPALECDERLANKSPKEALAAYDEAIKANPADAKALLQRAALRRRENDLQGTLADLDAVIRLDAGNQVALTMRSNVRAAQKDYDGALADSDAALASGVRTAQLYASRGAILRAKKDCTRAVVEYEEALKLDPQHQGAQRGIASCREGTEKKGT
ncbi:hypothetical protein BWI17_02185 [Betaproteobacteria bacterium GR16-43]|nr:hypothetical protein BWI17_02185 [Betaproteobacteria bacterium GR16-43]